MQGRVTYWSPSSEAIYGYKSEEVIGKALKSFLVPAENQKEFSELIKKISGRGERVTDFVARRKTKDRRILDVLLNIFALTDDDGNIIGSCIIAKDITQQLAQEEQVRKQHNILQQAEELAKTGSWEYNTSTREFLWSDGMFELFDIRKGTKVSPPIYVENSIDADKAVAIKIVQSIQSKFEPFEEIIHIKGRTVSRRLQ
jgi:PAS domain S-box-containing protein